MSVIYSETWDADCTPPALPTAWNSSPFLVTSSSQPDGVGPWSSPAYLYCAGGNIGTFFATYNAATDGAGGNCTVEGYCTAYIATFNQVRSGVAARGSSATLGSGTSCYAAWLDWGTGQAGISKVISGSETTLASVTAPGAFLAGTVWYVLTFTLSGTSLTLSVEQTSSDQYLTPSGTWAYASPQNCISITDSSISGAGYAGCYFKGNTAPAFVDNWIFSAAASNVDRPFILVVPVPYQYQPYHAE